MSGAGKNIFTLEHFRVFTQSRKQKKNCLYAISSTACSAAFFSECQIITINLYELSA